MIERVAIAYQNSQRAFARGSRNLDGDLLDDAFPAIGRQYSFKRNFLARTSLGYIGAGAFQARPSALANQIEIKVHTLHGGSRVRIVVDAAQTFSQRHGGLHGRGLRAFGWREHVLHGDVGKALHADIAVETVSDFLAEFVYAV